MKDWNKPEEHI